MIKLTRQWAGCYTYKHFTIEKDQSHLMGSQDYWWCDQVAKGRPFRTLKGVKQAIELKEKGQLSSMLLEECLDM